MEVDIVACARMQRKLQPSVLIDAHSRLLEDTGAESVAEDVIMIASEMERGASIPTGVLRPGEQGEKLGDSEGLLSSLREVYRHIVIVGSLEVVQDLCVPVRPGQIAAVAVSV